jgi:peroxiredoxin Q/BCP
MKTFIILAVCLAVIAFIFVSNASAETGKVVDPAYDAPKITAPDQDGKDVNFAEVYAKGTTVVFFYPKAMTPGCTKQACSLRDAYADLTKDGVQVLGVSVDSAESQRKFITKNHLPYSLIADLKGEVAAAFNVSKTLGMASRQAFIIKGGKVVWHAPKASTATQADDIKAALAGLK